ncbi:GNAT family N-acetyltransferase, partial [Nocardioides sp.]|uniref:GNAT family N-acetyltransferase n=1 Tax=Nocardioides sp. TaxID=35761 RepID=UPI00286BB005
MSSLEQIAAAAEAADGASAVDEATWRAVRHHSERVRSWVEETGFALLIDNEVTLVVSPDDRGRGVGRSLLRQALEAVGEGRVLAWSHGDHPAAAALAAAYGFERVRELWVMRRRTGDA